MKTFTLISAALFVAGCSTTSSDDYNAQSMSRANADYLRTGVVPPMDPSRKISEQDCTQGIDIGLGNLRCK